MHEESIQVDPEIVREFVAEFTESMNEVERDLVVWEKQPDSREIQERVFRAFHTLKGTSGLFGFERLESLAHQAESMLCGVREGHLAVDNLTVTALLKVLDAVRALLRVVVRDESDDDDDDEGDYEVLVAELNLKALQKQVMSNAEMGRQSAAGAGSPAMADNTVRVNVALLDHLSDIVLRLTEERDAILRQSQAIHNAELAGTAGRLDGIIMELQTGLMKTRLQPVGVIWGKFPRLVRDVALSTGKQIGLVMSGADMEVDRRIIEALSDPMTHLVRNCIDHGIETPELRKGRGKPEQGCITLRAYKEAGKIIFEVEDDGAGLRVDLIRETALRRGLITAEELARLGEPELQNMIFLPGFSTAAEVTKISGRGVGMDVVKTNLERIGGAIQTTSRPGQGTLFKIEIRNRFLT
jgi:two-component system chemotaxis sensor kinase CheA